MTHHLSIEIIIPVKNAENTISSCLDSLLKLDYPHRIITVIDDGSTDNTLSILHSYKPNINVITTNGVGPSKARNMAVALSKAEMIAFTDADCIVDQDWLDELLKGFQQFPQAQAVGGCQQEPINVTPFEKLIFHFMKKASLIAEYMHPSSSHNIREVNHNASCNVMYKKEILQNAQGFREDLWPGEDVELDFRLKKKECSLFFNPAAVVYHHRPKDLTSFKMMMTRYGLAQGFLVRQYGLFRKIHLVPFLSFIAILSIVLFLWSAPQLLIALEWIMFFILGGMLGLFLFFDRNIALCSITTHALWCWHKGFLIGFIFNKSKL